MNRRLTCISFYFSNVIIYKIPYKRVNLKLLHHRQFEIVFYFQVWTGQYLISFVNKRKNISICWITFILRNIYSNCYILGGVSKPNNDMPSLFPHMRRFFVYLILRNSPLVALIFLFLLGNFMVLKTIIVIWKENSQIFLIKLWIIQMIGFSYY